MNVHHLELFYYVGRYGGITEAVRNIPYGIQQPAVSGQIAQLEDSLGEKLFQRRPFALTPPGEKLFHYIQPFFSGLDALEAELQGGQTRRIRLGASPVVLREHMPAFLKNLRQKFPKLRVRLTEGTPLVLEKLIEQGELDLAVSVVEKKMPAGVRSQELITLPLALIVPRQSPIKSPEDLWREDTIQQPLISLPAAEPIPRRFQQGLRCVGVEWFPAIEVASLGLVETYAAQGFGIGVSVVVPGSFRLEGLRVLPLDPKVFAPLAVGALWSGRLSPVRQALLDELRLAANRMSARL